MDELVKRIVEKELVKSPAHNFTDKVMDEIFTMNESLNVKPLISVRIWYLIGSILLSITVAVSVLNPQSTMETNLVNIQKIVLFFSSLKFPAFDLFSNINLFVLLGTSLALLFLTLFDIVLFRKR